MNYRDYSITVLTEIGPINGPKELEWVYGRAYHYGMEPPRYPVPSLLADVTFWTGKDNPFCSGTELIIWKHGYSRRTGEPTRVVSRIWYPKP